jgi:hypothetical protein
MLNVKEVLIVKMFAVPTQSKKIFSPQGFKFKGKLMLQDRGFSPVVKNISRGQGPLL